MAQRIKPRITVTVDPDMLEEVDTYIQEHAGTDRSQIVDEALRCWYAYVLHEALVRQHSAPKSPEEREERAVWKRIRAAQMLRTDQYHLRGEE
ncbi:MAG: ribbon-helix-helix domain-containing protein [Dehalococcoidia bacterium]|nr:ribbon-helix-helix domain-containing protein [Dehalococcoidia bacterium]